MDFWRDFVPPPLRRGLGGVVILRFRKKPKYLYFCHIERLAKYLYFIAYFEILRSLRSLSMTIIAVIASRAFTALQSKSPLSCR
ncbi:hypothetical protein [Helicobacter sp. T3_23-1059]